MSLEHEDVPSARRPRAGEVGAMHLLFVHSRDQCKIFTSPGATPEPRASSGADTPCRHTCDYNGLQTACPPQRLFTAPAKIPFPGVPKRCKCNAYAVARLASLGIAMRTYYPFRVHAVDRQRQIRGSHPCLHSKEHGTVFQATRGFNASHHTHNRAFLQVFRSHQNMWMRRY